MFGLGKKDAYVCNQMAHRVKPGKTEEKMMMINNIKTLYMKYSQQNSVWPAILSMHDDDDDEEVNIEDRDLG